MPIKSPSPETWRREGYSVIHSAHSGRERKNAAIHLCRIETHAGHRVCSYKGTSLIRKRTPIGSYRRPIPGGSYGGPRGVDVFSWARYPCATNRGGRIYQHPR